jgi:hypothetical protein
LSAKSFAQRSISGQERAWHGLNPLRFRRKSA